MTLIGENLNKNSIANLKIVALNADVSFIISIANERRLQVFVYNDNGSDCWIKFQAASVDNDKKGIFLPKNSFISLMPERDKYTGEISAIRTVAATNLYITEF